MSDSDTSSKQELKRERSRSPLDSDRRRMDRKSGMKSSSGGGRGRRNSSRVVISNIPYEYKWQDLKDLFRNEVGEVSYVELFKDDTGRPRGAGVIEFENSDLARKAIENMHRYELAGRKLVVKEDLGEEDRRKERRSMMSNNGGGGMGMGGLGMGMGAGMGAMGGGNLSNFVNQSRLSDTRSVGGVSGGSSVNYGNTYGLSVAFLESLGISGPLGTRIFVANLNYDVDEDQLKEVFKIAGKVTKVELSRDTENNKSRGFGVVEYDHPVEAVQAISMLHGQWYFDRKMSVRMDRVSESKKQEAASAPKLPSGLKGIGMGLGAHGNALTDVSTINTNTATMQNAPMTMGMGQSMMGMGTGLMGNNPMQSALGGGGQGLMGMGGAMDSGLGGNMMGAGMGNMMGGGGGLNPQMRSHMDRYSNESSLMGFSAHSVEPQTRLQVFNLPTNMSWQSLRDMCRKYGKVQFAEIRQKGTGTVRFTTESDAINARDQLCREKMDGKFLDARLV